MKRGARPVGLLRDRRGGVAVVLAATLPVVLATAGGTLDLSVWYREDFRLQLAADAGAMGAARLLPGHTAQTADFQAAALLEINAASAGAYAIGTLATPVGISQSGWTAVTVTIRSTATSWFGGLLRLTAPTLHATAQAGVVPPPATACVLALNASAAPAIQVDNMGSIVATGCGIFSNSAATRSVYLNSGTLSGNAVGAVGGVEQSNSGSNTLNPSPGNSDQSSVADPLAGTPAPSYGTCSYMNASFTAWRATPYQFTQAANVFCGNTTIGGNGSTDTFAPGTYYVVNGNLVFNNATVTQAQGVQFILTGSNPGALSWTNYSNTTTTMTAPTTGPQAGILFWQTCPAGGSAPANTFAGGSTLAIDGAIYTPCGALDLSNNAKIVPQSGGAATYVANTIHTTGSAGITAQTTGGSSGGATTTVQLLQ